MRPLPRQATDVVSSPSLIASSSSRSRRDDTITPVLLVCYDDCNGAYREFERLGAVPELCDPDSEFVTLSSRCIDCSIINALNLDISDPLSEVLSTCNTSSGAHYTISTSWLTRSTTLSVIAVPSILDGSITVSQVYTVVVDVLVTRADWTGFDQSTTIIPPTSLTTEAKGVETSNSESGDTSGSAGSQAWIAGPVIGGVAGLAMLVGIYFFFARRRKRSRSREEAWPGKPELPAESVPGPPKTLLEIDAESRPPQELEGDYYVSADRQTHWGAAEMAANEVAAREMDVKSSGQEPEVQPPSRPLAGNMY